MFRKSFIHRALTGALIGGLRQSVIRRRIAQRPRMAWIKRQLGLGPWGEMLEMAGAPAFKELRDLAAAVSDAVEAVRQPLFDTIIYPTAGITQLRFLPVAAKARPQRRTRCREHAEDPRRHQHGAARPALNPKVFLQHLARSDLRAGQR